MARWEYKAVDLFTITYIEPKMYDDYQYESEYGEYEEHEYSDNEKIVLGKDVSEYGEIRDSNGLSLYYANEVTYKGNTYDTAYIVYAPEYKPIKLPEGDKSYFFSAHGSYREIYENIKVMDLHLLDASECYSLRWLFEGNVNLIDVDISGLNVGKNLTGYSEIDMSEMFEGCESLERVKLPSLEGTLVPVRAEKLFYNCAKLSELDLSDFHWESFNFNAANYMFGHCESLNTIYSYDAYGVVELNRQNDLFDGVDRTLIGEKGSSYITSDESGAIIDRGEDNPGYFSVPHYTFPREWYIDIEGNDMRLKKEWGSFTLRELPAFKIVYESDLPAEVEFLGEIKDSGDVSYPGFGLELYCDEYSYYVCAKDPNKEIRGVDDLSHLFDVDYSSPVIDEWTILEMRCFESIDLSLLDLRAEEGSVHKFGTTNTSYMFKGCENLTEIKTDSILFDTQNVTDMSYMFAECFLIDTIDVSGFDTSEVLNMENMFDCCTELVTLNMDKDKFNTSKVTNMKSMFGSCEKMPYIDVSKFDTAKVEDMSYMFYGCKKAQVFDLSSFDTSQVTVMNNMFYNCEEFIILRIDKDKFNTSKVTKMSSMFGGCKSLPELDISYFDTAKVTSMSMMFYNCETLEKLTIDKDKFNTSEVTNMWYMFEGCKSLQTLDVSGFNTAKVTDMRSMFKGCKSLQTLDVSSFDTSKVEDTDYMFADCESLTTIDTSQWTLNDNTNFYNMYYMFSNCKKLKKVDLSKFTTTTHKQMKYMFNGCENLETIKFNCNKFSTANVEDMSHMFDGCVKLTNVEAIFDTRNVKDMSYMFNNCKLLKDVFNSTVSNSIDVRKFNTSKVTNMSYIFAGTNLNILDISNFDTSNVTNMSNMFADCTDLKTIMSNDFNTTKVTQSTDMFKNCNSILGEEGMTYDASKIDYTYAIIDENKSASREGYFTKQRYIFPKEWYIGVDGSNLMDEINPPTGFSISSSVGNTYVGEIKDSFGLKLYTTSNGGYQVYAEDTNREIISEKDMSHIFDLADLSQCTKIIIDKLDTRKEENSVYKTGTTDMSFMFNGCKALTTLSIDKNIFDTKETTDMDHMFNECKALTNVDVSGFDTANVTNMDYMFSECNALTNVNVSGFDTANAINMDHMFNGCNALTKIDVSGFDVSKVATMSYMFAGCKTISTLSTVEWKTPEVINTSYMFYDCDSLDAIDLSNFTTKNVTDMSCMFAECDKLVTIFSRDFKTTALASGKDADMFKNSGSCIFFM